MKLAFSAHLFAFLAYQPTVRMITNSTFLDGCLECCVNYLHPNASTTTYPQCAAKESEQMTRCPRRSRFYDAAGAAPPGNQLLGLFPRWIHGEKHPQSLFGWSFTFFQIKCFIGAQHRNVCPPAVACRHDTTSLVGIKGINISLPINLAVPTGQMIECRFRHLGAP